MDHRNIFVGDDVSNLRIHQILNRLFGTNYKGWMRAWYDINEDFAAWFPTMSSSEARPCGTYGGTRNCCNTLSSDGNTITETDYAYDPSGEKEKYDKHRLVFSRINGQFYFVGIFDRKEIISDPIAGTATKIHTKIADGIDLETLEMYRKL